MARAELKIRIGAQDKATPVLKRLRSSIFNLRNVIITSLGTVAVGGLIKSIVSVGDEVEQLKLRLEALYGSQKLASEGFEFIRKVASQVPFSLEEVARAGVTLEAFGANMKKWLPVLTDLAAVMGVSLVDAANALGRAFAGGMGAADIFRERGILQMIRDFKKWDATYKPSLEEFRQAMYETFTASAEMGGKIAGASKKLASTLKGQLSMLGDAIFSIKQSLAEAGILDLLKIIVKNLTDVFRGIGKDIEKNKEQWLTLFTVIMTGSIKTGEVFYTIFSDILTLLSGLLKGISDIFKYLTWGEAKRELEGFSSAMESFGTLIQKQKFRVQDLANTMIDDMFNAYEKNLQKIRETDESGKEFSETIKQTTEAIKGMAIPQIQLTNELIKQKIGFDDLKLALQDITQYYQAYIPSAQAEFLAGFTETMRYIDITLREFGSNMASYIGKGIDMMIEGFMRGRVNFSQMIKSMIQDIMKLLMKMAIMRGLMTFFGIPAMGIPIGFKKGGLVRKFQFGGLVPGVGFRDIIPAFLSPGEYVLPRNIVRELGLSRLERLRRGESMDTYNITINISGITQGIDEYTIKSTLVKAIKEAKRERRL